MKKTKAVSHLTPQKPVQYFIKYATCYIFILISEMYYYFLKVFKLNPTFCILHTTERAADYTILYYTIQYYTILYYIILYYTIAIVAVAKTIINNINNQNSSILPHSTTAESSCSLSITLRNQPRCCSFS